MSIHPDLAGGRLTVDLGALVSNWHLLAKKSGSAECSAVVKANAYGCGIEPVVAALHNAGCQSFFVALADEGIRVKTVAPQARCFVLNGLFPAAAPHFLKNDLIPVLGSMAEISAWSAFAKSTGTPLPCALHIDSGMTRLGVSSSQFETLVSASDLTAWLSPQLLMTHYACADDMDDPKTDRQRSNFVQIAELMPNIPRSSANSAAVLREDGHEFDLVRPGVALYGGEALNDTENPMKPVVTLEGRIIQIRDAKTGEAVGYGSTEVLKRDTKIAYISVGYADGYHRGSSNMGVPMRTVAASAKAAYKGQIINGLGRISMDISAFDITDIAEDQIAAGDFVELFGGTIAVDDVARAAGTIGYELLTALGQRYSRTYLPVNCDG